MSRIGAGVRLFSVTTVAAGVIVAALLAWRGERLRTDPERAALGILAHLPLQARCGAPLGEWAALARGDAQDDGTTCFAELASGGLARRLLVRIAREPGRSDTARIGAIEALAAGDDLPDELVLDLLVSPRTRPSVRHAALDLLAARSDGVRWADLAADLPTHGMAERGTLHLAAAGEEDRDRVVVDAARTVAPYAPRRAERALAELLGLPPAELRNRRRWVYLELGEADLLEQWPCGRDCVEPLVRLLDRRARLAGADDPPEAPPWPGDAPLLDAISADGEVANEVRAHLSSLATWVRMGGDEEAAFRLRAALAHPEAGGEGEGFVAGTPGAVLDGAVGSPGVQALLLRLVADAGGVQIELRRGADDQGEGGDGMLLARLPGHGSAFPLGGCHTEADPEPAWAAARPIREGEVEAMAVEEAIGAALRRGDRGALPTLMEAARRYPQEAPAARAVVIGTAALGDLPAVAEGDPEAAWAARAANVGPDAVIAAAWWAAEAKHDGLARALLANAGSAWSEGGARLHTAVAARLGEPGAAAASPTAGDSLDAPDAIAPPGSCGGPPTLWPAATPTP